MTRPVLEFVSLMRPAFSIDGPEVVIGRSAGCTLQLEADGVAEKHARIRVTPGGDVTVQDLDSFSGTQKNGSFVYGQQVLSDGDELRIGGVTLRFRKTAPASFADPSSAGRTLMGVGPPPELQAVLGTQTVEMAPVTDDAGVMVGAAEPEPTNNRTVQMDSSAIEALLKADAAKGKQPEVSFDAATTPGGGSGGGPSKMAFDEADRTVATAPQFGEDATLAQKQRGREAFAQTLPPPSAAEYEKLRGELNAAREAAKASQAPLAAPMPSGNQQRTIAMQAPTVPPAAPPAPAPQPKTMMAEAPVLPGKLPTAPQPPLAAPMPSGNQQRTIAMQAPTVPPTAPPAPAPKPAAQEQPKTMMAQAPVVPIAPLPPAPKPPAAQEQPRTMMAQAPVLPVAPKPPVAALPAAPPVAPLGGVTAPSMPVIPAPPPPQSTQQMPAPQQGYGAYVPPGSQTTQPPAYQQQTTQPPSYQQQQQQQQPMSSAHNEPYTPPQRGPFGSFSRAFAFIGQMFSLAFKHKAILSPILWDLAITTPISIGIGIAMGFVHSEGAFYGLLAVGTLMLYFVDYCCNAFTASLMYDYATTGQADGARARSRVMKALGGILVFAGVSALLDVASTYARERNDVLAKVMLRILRAIWTTATYVIMPAMVIEGVSFGDAFGRSKQLMEKDPTGVGAGIVAMSITSYIAAIIIFPLAYFALRFGGHIHPALGGILFFTFINLYWSVSGWLKIAYSTCFYVWARECQRTGSQDHALAPRPLRTAIDAG
jgi:hypothetical protein